MDADLDDNVGTTIQTWLSQKVGGESPIHT